MELHVGDQVEIEITNHGDATHDFTIEALGISTGAIDAGEAATATLTVPEGETGFVCSLHDGMKGMIVGA